MSDHLETLRQILKERLGDRFDEDRFEECVRWATSPRTPEEIIAEHPEGPGECKAIFTDLSCEEFLRDAQTLKWWPELLDDGPDQKTS